MSPDCDITDTFDNASLITSRRLRRDKNKFRYGISVIMMREFDVLSDGVNEFNVVVDSFFFCIVTFTFYETLTTIWVESPKVMEFLRALNECVTKSMCKRREKSLLTRALRSQQPKFLCACDFFSRGSSTLAMVNLHDRQIRCANLQKKLNSLIMEPSIANLANPEAKKSRKHE